MTNEQEIERLESDVLMKAHGWAMMLEGHRPQGLDRAAIAAHLVDSSIGESLLMGNHDGSLTGAKMVMYEGPELWVVINIHDARYTIEVVRGGIVGTVEAEITGADRVGILSEFTQRGGMAPR